MHHLLRQLLQVFVITRNLVEVPQLLDVHGTRLLHFGLVELDDGLEIAFLCVTNGDLVHNDMRLLRIRTVRGFATQGKFLATFVVPPIRNGIPSRLKAPTFSLVQHQGNVV